MIKLLGRWMLIAIAAMWIGAMVGMFIEKDADAGQGYGDIFVASARLVYSSTNVGTVTPVALPSPMSSLPSDCAHLDIFDSSGQTLELMVGPSGSEKRVRLIPPGGNGLVSQWLFSGSRVSVRALSGTANAGELDISCLQD